MQSEHQKAVEELAKIPGQIAALEKRRQELTQYIALGQRLFGAPAEGDVSLVGSPAIPAGASVKSLVLAHVRSMLAQGKPMRTRQLLESLEMVGVEVGGKDKVLALSVMLNRSKEFKADRKYGWSLKKESP